MGRAGADLRHECPLLRDNSKGHGQGAWGQVGGQPVREVPGSGARGVTPGVRTAPRHVHTQYFGKRGYAPYSNSRVTATAPVSLLSLSLRPGHVPALGSQASQCMWALWGAVTALGSLGQGGRPKAPDKRQDCRQMQIAKQQECFHMHGEVQTCPSCGPEGSLPALPEGT